MILSDGYQGGARKVIVEEIENDEAIVRVRLERGVRRIGVLSDSHVPLRARCLPTELLTRLQGVDLILHAGDLVDESVLLKLHSVAPVEAVAGNMDPPHLHEQLKRRKLLQSGGLKIGLIHGDGMRMAARQRAEEAFRDVQPQVIVFGHSHQPRCTYSGDTLLFNPGSCVDPRWAGGPSYGILHLNSAGVTGEIIYL